MEILMIEGNPFWVEPNGLTKHVEDLSSQLVKQYGDSVTVLSAADFDDQEKIHIIWKNGVRYFLMNRTIGKHLLNDFPNPMPPMCAWVSNNLFVATCVRELNDLLRDSNFDLIHVHDYFLLNALELILKKINIPVVATVHAINDFPNHFGEGMRNYMLRNATNVIVVSEWLRDVVLERFQFMHPEVIQVIANGVSMPDEMQNISGNHNNYITFSGRLEYKKGVDILINAYVTALEKDETLPDLVIMGDGTGRRNFVKIAQELGISHRVHFTGMISNLDVHQNLINSAMHVVPSLAEPFGITAIESMLDGTPVIASNSGGLKEIVEDEKTGLLVSPGDVDMLASAILRLWQHPELRKKLAGASIEKARNVYTWENVSAFTRNVYTQAIANGNGC